MDTFGPPLRLLWIFAMAAAFALLIAELLDRRLRVWEFAALSVLCVIPATGAHYAIWRIMGWRRSGKNTS